MDVEGYSAIALVLTPSSFDLETLQGLRRWKVNRKSNMSIGERSMGISNGAVVWTSVLLARFANNQGKTYFGESSAEAPWTLEVTAALQARGFVERLESEPGVQRWALTALGSSQIRHHDLLFDFQKVESTGCSAQGHVHSRALGAAGTRRLGLQPRVVEVPPNGGQEQPVQVWGSQDVVVVFSYAFNFLNELQVYGLLAYGHDAPAASPPLRLRKELP